MDIADHMQNFMNKLQTKNEHLLRDPKISKYFGRVR